MCNKLENIEAKLDKVLAKRLPSSLDKLTADGNFVITRHFVWDYQNIASTVLKNIPCLFIDIGANVGQSAKFAYEFFSNVKVISYEPLKSLLPELEKVKNKHTDYVYKNIAVSDKNGTLTIYEIGDKKGLSSSLKLKEDYTYFKGKFDTAVTNSYEVPCVALKDEIEQWQQFGCKKKVLKIDTQGTELSILKNVQEYLSNGNIDVLMIEIATIEKYEGQPDYLETIKFIKECGFKIYNILPIYRELDGKYVSCDGFGFGWATEFDFTFVHQKTLSGLVDEN